MVEGSITAGITIASNRSQSTSPRCQPLAMQSEMREYVASFSRSKSASRRSTNCNWVSSRPAHSQVEDPTMPRGVTNSTFRRSSRHAVRSVRLVGVTNSPAAVGSFGSHDSKKSVRLGNFAIVQHRRRQTDQRPPQGVESAAAGGLCGCPARQSGIRYCFFPRPARQGVDDSRRNSHFRTTFTASRSRSSLIRSR